MNGRPLPVGGLLTVADETTEATSPWKVVFWPAVAAAVLHAFFMARYAGRYNGDPAALICVAEARVSKAPFEAIRTGVGATGYEGQFYYALARSPWTVHDAAEIDAPAAQHLRVLYPAVCWLFSGGDPELLVWVMPAVNLLAIAALAGLGGWLAWRHELCPWWGFLLPLALNVGLAALRNLTDPLATLMLFALLTGWVMRAPSWALGVAAGGALFGREQNVVVVLLLVGLALAERRRGPAVALGCALALWSGWVVALRLAYGAWPFLQGGHNLGAPLEGLLFRWTHLGYPTGATQLTLLHLGLMLHLLLTGALAVYLFVAARDSGRAAPLVALAGAGLALVAGVSIYEDYWSYTRVLVWLPLGLWVAGVQARRAWVLLLLVPASVCVLGATRLM